MTTEAAARAELEALGASLVITSSYTAHATVAAGHVISQSPAAGTLVAPGSTVHLVVSTGPLPASRWSGSTPEITQAAVAASSASDAPPSIVMATLVFMDFPGDPTYVTDAGSNLNWDGHEWIGLGQYGSIEGPSETLDMIAQPFRLTVSGVDTGIVTAAMDTVYAGRDVDVYVAILDPHTYAFLDTPTELCKGYMSVMTINADKNSGSIVLECEHRLRRLPTSRRWTDEDQRSRYSADVFFQFTHEIRGYVSKAAGRDVSYDGPGWGRVNDRRNRPF